MKYFLIMVIYLLSLYTKAEENGLRFKVDLINNSNDEKQVDLRYGIENKKNYIYWVMNNSTINNEYSFKIDLNSKFSGEIDKKSGFVFLNSINLDYQPSTHFKGLTFVGMEGQYFYKINENTMITLKLSEVLHEVELEGLSKFHLASISTKDKYFKLSSMIKKIFGNNNEQSELINNISIRYEYLNYGILFEYETKTGNFDKNEKTSIVTYIDFSIDLHSELSLGRNHDFTINDLSTDASISLTYDF